MSKQTEQIILEEGILNNTKWPTVEKIVKAGINTVGDLARQTPYKLAEQSGVGESTCEKYITIAIGMVEEGYITGSQLLERIGNRKRLTTSSSEIDEMLRPEEEEKTGKRGGIESDTITEIAGEEGMGKTQVAHQLAVNVQLPVEEGGLEGKCFWVSTENTFRPERITQICKYREHDVKKTLDNILYKEAFNTVHQQKIISQLPQVCQEHNVKLVVVDSMMSHLRSEYIGRAMLSSRQQTLSDMLQRLNKLAQQQHIVIVYTNQVMGNPSGYGSQAKAIGGHIMGHAGNLRLFIRRGRTKSSGQPTRFMKITKSPYLPEREAPFMITERGIEDV